jgi:hypothetical protein
MEIISYGKHKTEQWLIMAAITQATYNKLGDKINMHTTLLKDSLST